MPGEPSNPKVMLAEYSSLVDDAYALFLDAMSAMPKFATWLEDSQRRSLEMFRGHENGPTTVEELDNTSFLYGTGDPNKPEEVRVQHESTQGEVKARNQQHGVNCRTVSRVLIITIYQFWEDHYRQQFANLVGKAKNEIASDFFGDIRHLRNDIIHHRNFASERVAKCKRLKYFEPGDEIFLSQDEAIEVMSELRAALDELCIEFTGATGEFANRVSVSGYRHI
ncbi:hypothetical protein [Bradyrhizobium sp. th.b2]|uniref:hypothetical protein n=1 Tax=Bradyrhizobium sp. th-b2 TaxID=172088 RepID=UPI0003F7FBE3|nr:hypothetical protein [Bradyrhizobium sp. th.b2]